MNRYLLVLTVIVGCGGDDTSLGGADTLPKRGERASDPTIISATAECNGARDTEVMIGASDPMGEANLGTCSVTIGARTEQSSFYQGLCEVTIDDTNCMPGPIVIAITVGNKTGGVTTASVGTNVTPGYVPPDAPSQVDAH